MLDAYSSWVCTSALKRVALTSCGQDERFCLRHAVVLLAFFVMVSLLNTL